MGNKKLFKAIRTTAFRLGKMEAKRAPKQEITQVECELNLLLQEAFYAAGGKKRSNRRK